uniref:clostripain-related cysteine peptidase n=1 Tax=Butyrivibrio sp. TaxID=28121 RepID=UPI0025E4DFE2
TSLTSTGSGWMTAASNTYQDTTMSSADTTVDAAARDKFTTIKGGGEDIVTVMVYMCGADLESRSGMATRDLNEMVYADISDKVNVIVETGGAKKWQNSVISASTNQRWKVEKGGLVALDKNVGSKQMTDPDTLVDFVNYAKENYPADRYMLIFWDHGGGSVSGYGYDELYPNATMTIDEIQTALKQTGITYDFVGFDACLMAGMETAMAVEPCADYLIASEETEPGTGWYYTNWLTALSQNTSISTVELGKKIIDDFTSACASQSSRSKTTLSIIDLAEFKGVIPDVLTSFGTSLNTQLKSENYQEVAKARSDTREFASSSHIDQVDLVNFCNNLGTDEAKELADAVKGCVKYNKTYNVTNAYGMSIYFPYSSLRSVNSMVKIYENLDMDGSYSDSIKSFATLESSGQIVTSQSSQGTGLFDVLLGGSGSSSSSSSVDITSILMQALSGSGSSVNSSYSGSGSGYGSILDFASLLGGSGLVSSDSISDIASLLGNRAVITSDDLATTQKDGQDVVVLSEDQWSQMKAVGLNVFVDDGAGYIDLGIDNVASYNDDGDLIVTYDGTWMAVNGQFVAFYICQDDYDADTGYYYLLGYIPAELNGEYVNIMVEFSSDNEAGLILGAQAVYKGSDGENSFSTEGKGLVEIVEGDKIDFLCDYYSYDGTFQDSYFLNEESLVVDSDGLYIETLTMDNENVYYSYRLTDYLNSNYWTPVQKY